MTTPEHTLVGIHCAFATGIHRLVGWRGVAMAGIASNLPDWDGLPMLFDMQRFESGHRVWGHNLLLIAITSLVLGFILVRWDLLGNTTNRFNSLASMAQADDDARNPRWRLGETGFIIFAAITLFAQVVHLPCDMVVSGGDGLSDWAVKPWWPFSDAAYVYPLIPWGDVGPTIILMAGVVIIAQRRSHLSLTSLLTIITLCGYLMVRAWIRETFVA